ncbi:hypothetical protein BGX34_007993 [Mortierella sp. NVP85]|nr:hypothetical protein BGX34_007993 [Mortierella sp. NVP85]
MAAIPPPVFEPTFPPATQNPTGSPGIISPITLATTTTRRSQRTTTPSTPLALPSGTNSDSAVSGSDNGRMGGGAVAGLVIGILALLACSLVGGFLLLKKRRERMMTTGRRGYGYPDASSSSKQYTDPEDDDGEKGGALASLMSGLVSKVRKPLGGSSARTGAVQQQQQHQQQYTPQYQQHQQPPQSRTMTPFGSDRAISPTPEPVGQGSLPRPGAVPSYGSASSFQTHQSGMLPPTGPLPFNIPPSQNNTLPQQQQPSVGGYPGTTFSPHQQHQQVPLYNQQPLHQQQSQQPQHQQPLQQSTLAQSITAPASQPYYYQPGTGLVSVPLNLPPAQQQPHVQQQMTPQVQQQYQQPVHSPAQYTYRRAPGSHNHAASPMVVGAASHVPPPYQAQRTQLQPPVSLQPTAVVPPSISATPIPTSVQQARAVSPEPNSIFLPGDASRPLLGQGLFKIVPDAEDEEEARRAVAARSNNGSTSDGRVQLDMDMSLGGDLLSSVITYENQDDRFRALEATQPGQPALSKRRSAGHKQELDESDQQELPEPRNASQEIVIVGSDIVLEPLPSAKAAAAAAAKVAGNSSHDSAAGSSSSNETGTYKSKLTRHATIGAVLPTMGTEEYLERTDDKEEYSAGLHGGSSFAGSSAAPSIKSVIVHPPTRTELGKAAQGDILGVTTLETQSPPETSTLVPDALTTSSTVYSSSASSSATSSTAPPPLARSTKPKLGA